MNNLENFNFHNKEIGQLGEEEACKYLKKSNYNIICRNFLSRNGEIDIIAKDNDEYVFIEVKTRMSRKYGNPAEAVSYNKQKHILNTAKYYIFKYSLENKNIRFDIIEVYINKKDILINHIKNVFI